MSHEQSLPVRRVAVRWPFRVLAALICATGVVAIGGTAYAIYDSRLVATDPMFVRLIVGIPGTLWVLRLAAHAALHGNVPSGEHPWWAIRVQTGDVRLLSSYIFRAFVRALTRWDRKHSVRFFPTIAFENSVVGGRSRLIAPLAAPAPVFSKRMPFAPSAAASVLMRRITASIFC